MTRLLVVGDTHGDFAFVSKACRVAQANDIKTIIQVGDFGIWDHYPEGVYFLNELNANAERRNVRWIFVPGNHENFDSLEEYQLDPYRTEEGFTVIRDRIHYTGKVAMWYWEGQSYKAVGGAVSIDKDARVPKKSWWWQEQLTNAELQQALDLGVTDFLFTHDCPTYAPFRGRLKPDIDSVIHRQKMDRVVEATNARVHFHGHMHSFYDYENYQGGKIWGLECNDDAMYRGNYQSLRNMAIFDTQTEQVEWPAQEGV